MDIGIAQEWVEVALTYIFFFAQPYTSTRVCDLVARASMPRWQNLLTCGEAGEAWLEPAKVGWCPAARRPATEQHWAGEVAASSATRHPASQPHLAPLTTWERQQDLAPCVSEEIQACKPARLIIRLLLQICSESVFVKLCLEKLRRQ